LRDDGIAATCLLAVLGLDVHEEIPDEETARRYTGALLLVRGLRRLDHITKLLTATE
jgi:hypothetical protein